jgi:hypothetical protein
MNGSGFSREGSDIKHMVPQSERIGRRVTWPKAPDAMGGGLLLILSHTCLSLASLDPWDTLDTSKRQRRYGNQGLVWIYCVIPGWFCGCSIVHQDIDSSFLSLPPSFFLPTIYTAPMATFYTNDHAGDAVQHFLSDPLDSDPCVHRNSSAVHWHSVKAFPLH